MVIQKLNFWTENSPGEHFHYSYQFITWFSVLLFEFNEWDKIDQKFFLNTVYIWTQYNFVFFIRHLFPCSSIITQNIYRTIFYYYNYVDFELTHNSGRQETFPLWTIVTQNLHFLRPLFTNISVLILFLYSPESILYGQCLECYLPYNI